MLKKYASCAKEIPDWGQKDVYLPSWEHDMVFWQKRKSSISVITYFFLDHLKNLTVKSYIVIYYRGLINDIYV